MNHFQKILAVFLFQSLAADALVAQQRPGSGSIPRPGSGGYQRLGGSSVPRPGAMGTDAGPDTMMPAPSGILRQLVRTLKSYSKSIANKGQLANGGSVVSGDTPVVRALAGVDPEGFTLVIPDDPVNPNGQTLLVSLPTDSDAVQFATRQRLSGRVPRPGDGERLQTMRYLRVANATRARVTANVLYRKRNDRGDWVWLPVHPRAGGAPLSVELQPGEVRALADKDGLIRGDRVRLWARSADNNEWQAFKDKDLWLVPEKHGAASPGYYSPRIETITFTLR